MNAGSNIVYDITVQNNGKSDAAPGVAVLQDVIPANTTFVSIVQTTGPAADTTSNEPPVGGTGTAMASFLNGFPAGSTATFTLTVAVDAATPNNTTISNQASINLTGETDPDLSDNTSALVNTTVHAAVAQADLKVTKTDLVSGTITAGNDLGYSIKLGNNSTNAATTVDLSDALPAGTTFVSFTQVSGTTHVHAHQAGRRLFGDRQSRCRQLAGQRTGRVSPRRPRTFQFRRHYDPQRGHRDGR